MLNIQALIDTLPTMLYGMAGIFIVIILIYLSVFLLQKLFPSGE